MEAALVIEALNRALDQRGGEPQRLLIHTDQCSQHRASDDLVRLARHEIACSLSAKGCCRNNTVVVSFFSSLKLERGLDDNRE